MGNFEQFRKDEKSGFHSDSQNLQRKAKIQHKQNHEGFKHQFAASSSISLPIWNAARFLAVHRKLQARNIKISRTDLLKAVMKIYIPKMKNDNPNMNRLRKKNDYLCKFVKISTYESLDDWDFLQLHALNVKICLSHAFDIALRLFLRQVEKRIMLPVTGKFRARWNQAKDSNVFLQSIRNRTVGQLSRLGKYQKILAENRKSKVRLQFSLSRDPSCRIPPFRHHEYST